VTGKRPWVGPPVTRLGELTPRQREAALRRAAGQTRPEMAAAMFIEPETLHGLMGQAEERTGTHSELRLVLWVWRQVGDPIRLV